MADEILQAELLAACSSLGYSDGNKYYRDPDCLETVKDLIKYLRRDDDSHAIRRALGETRVVQTDLIPIIRDFSDDDELFDVTLRLLVNLTNPVLLLFREELPEEKVTRQQFLQLIGHQQSCKEKFADENLWKALVKKLEVVLQQDWNDRQEEDRLNIERVLILIRNILAVPASPQDEQRTDDDASLHDQVIWALHLAEFEVLLMYIASSEQEHSLAMHSLEIISLMLREQDPEVLANTHLQRSKSEKDKDEKELMNILDQEAAKKQQRLKEMRSRRHSRFGGTYYVMNMKSISDRDVISHQPISNIKELNFDKSKKLRKLRKNLAPLQCSDNVRKSTLAIRMFLQEFCIEFLNGSYNSLMYTVKDNLVRGKSQENDETYYLWAMKFFMAFNRNHNFKIELVSETLSVQSFHYIQQCIENYYEMMSTDKKKIPLWSRRMHKGLRAYQELLLTLACMDKSDDSSIRESSKVIKCKIFYVPEYRELTLILTQNFDERKMTKKYLKDLIETNHIVLKLLENLCGKSKHLLVQGKAKTKKKRKKKPPTSKPMPTEEQLEEKWGEMSEELSDILRGENGELPSTVPFDALSDDPIESQKENAMLKINSLLRSGELKEAVSFLRSSREVWPEGDIFGSENMEASNEFTLLRTIFLANLNAEENPPVPAGESDEELEEDELEESVPSYSEQELDFTGYVQRFANSKVMPTYGILLKQYKSNSIYTNHCILKMFHRIAWDCKLTAMFYQLSLFKIFQGILNDPSRRSDENLKELGRFAKFIFKKFIETSKENKKVFVEVLFWKDRREATEIECGYDTFTGDNSDKKKSWSEEEEEELTRLFHEFKFKMSDPGEDDLVDCIMAAIIDKERNRRTIIKKLKELGLVTNLNQLKRKNPRKRIAYEWTEMEEEELKVLFDEHKDSNDPLGMILLYMVNPKPKIKVKQKLLELGIVNDPKDLRKKRQGKKGKNSKGNHSDDGQETENDNSSDDDIINSEDDLVSSSDDEEHPSAKDEQNVAPTPAEISNNLGKVLDTNNKEAVSWLASLLKDTANDREEDGDFEPVPILAISSQCVDAMEDSNFQNLLKVIGMKPPLNHQETFWRIPSNISIDGLRKRSQFLTQSLNGDLPSSGNIELSLDSPKKISKAKPIKAKSKINKSVRSEKSNKKRKEIEKENIFKDLNKNSDASDSEDDIPLSAIKVNSSNPLSDITADKNPNKKRSLNIHSDDDKSDDSIDQSSGNKQKKNKKRKLLIANDSDEDESMNLKLHLDTETLDVVETQSNFSKRIMDSDSEDDITSSSKKHVSRAIVIDSDED